MNLFNNSTRKEVMKSAYQIIKSSNFTLSMKAAINKAANMLKAVIYSFLNKVGVLSEVTATEEGGVLVLDYTATRGNKTRNRQYKITSNKFNSEFEAQRWLVDNCASQNPELLNLILNF